MRGGVRMISMDRFGLAAVVFALVFAALAALCPPLALAATVVVEPGSPPSRGKVLYQAAAGERNDVTVEREYETDPVVGVFQHSFIVTISDAGAVVTAGASCQSVDAHTARCRTGPGSDLDPVELELGDSNDQLRTAPSSFTTRGVGISVVADGGPGDDVLDLREGIASGILDGGGGRDQLYGGALPDFLMDGDRDGAPSDAGPGPDLLDGGGGIFASSDVVGYQQRTRPVFVDLASDRPAGEPGEGDVIREIESAVGGSAPDRLAGTNGPNYIVGGGGNDTLIGRRGTDRFGEVPLQPPADATRLALPKGTRGDTISCGRGIDDASLPTASTYVKPSCELLRLFTRDRYTLTAQLPYPTARRSSLSYPVRCSDEADFEDPRWEAVRCSGTVTLREAARPRRLLATGVVPRGRFVIPARLLLTTTGRRLATRSHGVRALMHISGKHLPTASWTIRLKLTG